MPRQQTSLVSRAMLLLGCTLCPSLQGWVVRFLAGISLYSFVFGHPEAPTVATVAAEGSLEMELEVVRALLSD